MHLGEISFCERQGYNVKSDDAKQAVLSSIESHFGVRIIQKHFDKFSDAALQRLSQSPHLVCERTNGNPYLLYLTRHNYVNQAVFVDKKVQQGYFYPRMVLVRAWFDDALFDGTLIDGEMVRGRDGRWFFMCHDLIALAGEHLTGKLLPERMELLRQLFETRFTPDPDNDYCEFCVKRFWSYDQIESLVHDYVPAQAYTCRGLLFKPMQLRHKDVLMNFDDSLVKKVVRIKYKDVSNFLTDTQHLAEATAHQSHQSHQSHQPAAPAAAAAAPAVVATPEPAAPQGAAGALCSFWARKTAKPDVYELFERQDCSGSAHIAAMPTLAVSRMMRGLFAGANAVERIAVLCEYSPRFEKWVPKEPVA